VFSAWSSPFSEESSFETPACQDMSLEAEELNWQLQTNGKKEIRL
jgi:hypothetical protein